MPELPRGSLPTSARGVSPHHFDSVILPLHLPLPTWSLTFLEVYSEFLGVIKYPEKHSPSFSFSPETVHLKEVFMPFSVFTGLFRLKRTHIRIYRY